MDGRIFASVLHGGVDACDVYWVGDKCERYDTGLESVVDCNKQL